MHFGESDEAQCTLRDFRRNGLMREAHNKQVMLQDTLTKFIGMHYRMCLLRMPEYHCRNASFGIPVLFVTICDGHT